MKGRAADMLKIMVNFPNSNLFIANSLFQNLILSGRKGVNPYKM